MRELPCWKRRASPTRRNGGFAWLASAHALNGDTERAATELAEARRPSSNDRYSSIARLTAAWAPKARARLEATYIAGLRKAGMPEE
jgi:hypothetical protein